MAQTKDILVRKEDFVVIWASDDIRYDAATDKFRDYVNHVSIQYASKFALEQGCTTVPDDWEGKKYRYKPALGWDLNPKWEVKVARQAVIDDFTTRIETLERRIQIMKDNWSNKQYTFPDW